MIPTAVIFVGLFGLLIGSFLNVVIYRVPRGESIATPGSHCPSCGHMLKSWELIPVLSFLMQAGRCRKCGMKISWRYPGVEILTGALFFLVAWQNGGVLDARLALSLIFTGTLIALAFIDYDTYRLPDVLTLPLLGIGIAGTFLIQGEPSGWESLASAALAGGVFWAIAWLYPKGMGMGDAKLVAAMGAFLGFPLILLAIFLGSLIGALAGIMISLAKGRNFRQQIPFGPFLAAGALASLLWGQQILDAYMAYIYR